VIGLDTNVIVRYIAQDDPAQSRKATALVEGEFSDSSPGFIGVVVLVEVVWVAESCYAASRAEVIQIVRRLLGTRHLVVENAEVVWQALQAFEQGKSDFADCVIERCAAAAGCTKTVTFDKAAAKSGMTLLS
jgi:predicted nucleic-acid-binding protein